MSLLGYKDAATVLGLPIGTVYSLVSRRQIPHVRLGRRLVRFDQAWVAKHRVAATPSEDAPVARPGERGRGRNANPKKGGKK